MATVAAKRKLSTKLIKEKYAALKEVEGGSSKSQVAMKYGVPKNTLSTWIKNKERIFESMKTQGNKTKRMRLKEGTFAKLDELIFKWLLTVRSRNVVVSASILKTKAKELAGKIDIEGFQASDGWLDRWKNRYNVSFKTVSGEGNSCTAEMTAPWKETTLPTILSKYKLDEIYNADEFGLFFRMQPNKSLNLRSESCTGGKHSKIRLTGMAAANATGDKIPMFVIGKSKSPRCFKGVKHLPCRYRNQNKSWMDSVLFEEWIREMDTKFTKEKKKVALIIDNCPAHPTIDNLKSIELVFLPPNTTSKLQPMDQGVIRSLKAYYKSLALQRLVVAIDKGKDLPVFSILDAMKMLDLAWQEVKTSTVVNCFAKAGISKDQQASAQSDDDDPFKDLQNQIEKLGDFYPPGTTVEDVISADQNVMSTEPLLSDEELIEEVMNAANGDDGDEDDDDEDVLLDPVCPKVSDIREALQVLHDYMPFSLCGEDIQQKLNALSISINRDVTAKMKQSDIRTFFQ